MESRKKELIRNFPDTLLQKTMELSKEYGVSEISASMALLTTHLFVLQLTMEEINGDLKREALLNESKDLRDN